MDQTALGVLLQHLREKRGLKLRELAQLANVDHAYVYRLEIGAKDRPSDQVLSKLIRGVNADKREAAILRYAAEHAATAPALAKLVIEDATISFDIFATAAGVAFRGAARPDVRRLVERVRRVLDEENDS